MQHEGVEKTVELPVGKVVPLELATVLGLICERREALPQQVVDLVFSEGVLASVSIAAARQLPLAMAELAGVFEEAEPIELIHTQRSCRLE